MECNDLFLGAERNVDLTLEFTNENNKIKQKQNRENTKRNLRSVKTNARIQRAT